MNGVIKTIKNDGDIFKIFLKYEVLRVVWTFFYLFPGFGRHFVSFVTTPNLFPLINNLRVYIVFTTIYNNFK